MNGHRMNCRAGRTTVEQDTPAAADGHVVAFVSRARLSATDSGGVENIYVFDRIAGIVRLETVTADGSAADGMSQRPMLSADGRYLVFASYATNLVTASDTNGRSDIFLG